MSVPPPNDPVVSPDSPKAPGSPGDSEAPADSVFWGSDETEGARSAAKQRRKRRRRRILLAVLVFVVLVILGLAGLIWQRQSSYLGNVDRIPKTMPEGERPGANVTGTQNWLLVGSDTRVKAGTTGDGGEALWKPGQQRSDTLMLLHLPAKKDKAYIISFPRDSWVDVPGYGTQKINAAFSYGGPPLLIRTVEQLTGIRIDHFGAIDFNGFKSMTDALGGVDVQIDKTVNDPMNNKTWQAGRNHLNGEDALKFVRQRYNLPNGDFDRIKRQQAFLRAVTQKAADGGTISNPFKLDRFMSAFTKTISVDDSISGGQLRSLALGMRGVRGSDISFMTVPNKGPAARGKASVVLLDPTKAKELFEAVRTAKVSDYVQLHGGANQVTKVS